MADHWHRSPLLRLPRELRDCIYSFLLNASDDPPPNPSFPGPRKRRDDIAYQKQYKTFRYPSLVWVNRQIRNEYFDLVDEVVRNQRLKAELDIMSNGFLMYPSWIYLPPELNAEPFDLDVHLRIFSTEAYRSSDGWPRQPGVGFRSLLTLLNELIQHGPSFGHNFELMRGKSQYFINRLSVNVSFHDDYTPATWPETSHNIFRMLKALAVDGLAKGVVRKVHARSAYLEHGQAVLFEREWDVSEKYDVNKAREWKSAGFLTPSQRRLSDDYRAALDDEYS